MSTWEYVNPVRNAIKIFSKERTPRQLALAVSLGMMVGLLPKGNLLAASFTIALLAFRVNLGVGLTTAFVLTLFSQQLDLLTHGIGLRLFKQPTVYEWLTKAHQLPVVAWMSLNNTVVMGSFLLGTALFYPTYHGSERAFAKLLPVLASLRRKKNESRREASNSPADLRPGDARFGNSELNAELAGAADPAALLPDSRHSTTSRDSTAKPLADESTLIGSRQSIAGSRDSIGFPSSTTAGEGESVTSYGGLPNCDSTFSSRANEAPDSLASLSTPDRHSKFAAPAPADFQSRDSTSGPLGAVVDRGVCVDGEVCGVGVVSVDPGRLSSGDHHAPSKSLSNDLNSTSVSYPQANASAPADGARVEVAKSDHVERNPGLGAEGISPDPAQVAMRPPLMTRSMLPSRKLADQGAHPLGRPSFDASQPAVSASELIQFSTSPLGAIPRPARLTDDQDSSPTRTLNSPPGE